VYWPDFLALRANPSSITAFLATNSTSQTQSPICIKETVSNLCIRLLEVRGPDFIVSNEGLLQCSLLGLFSRSSSAPFPLCLDCSLAVGGLPMHLTCNQVGDSTSVLAWWGGTFSIHPAASCLSIRCPCSAFTSPVGADSSGNYTTKTG
jgi:hypothetical protein